MRGQEDPGRAAATGKDMLLKAGAFRWVWDSGVGFVVEDLPPRLCAPCCERVL